MSAKAWSTVAVIIGSIIGGYVPTVFGASPLSITSLFTSTIGALLGLFIVYKMNS